MVLSNAISNAMETAVLKLIFQAVAWANYADNAAGTPETNIVISLHTADPGEAGTGTSNETAYTSYARTNVARTTGGWTETTGSISPAATISFPQCTGGTSTISHFAAGKSGGGASALLYRGDVTPNISAANGVTPQLTTSTTITLD
jgi:hypothetical protein